jgi:predicted DNA-binding protein with PD1-like motif
MKIHAFRLEGGCDPKDEIQRLVRAEQIEAGYVVTCVGGLSRAVLRMPGAKEYLDIKEDFEIVSLVGTLSPEGCHLHISVSDSSGSVLGGHLSSGSVVRLTAEVVVAEAPSLRFGRVYDENTGFAELVVKRRE